MASTVTTGTRRGLILTLYGDALLALTFLLFILLPDHAGLLVAGVLLSLIPGGPGGLFLLTNRREFGPEHAKSVQRAFLAFILLFLCLILAFFQITDAFPTSLKLTDLRAPWFFLGLAILADAAAIHLLLGHLVPERGRVWLRVMLALAALGTLVYAWLGWIAIEDYVRRSGEQLAVPAEASSYVRDFAHDVLRPWASAVLLVRVGFWPALFHALTNVAEAELDAQERAAWSPGEPPSSS